MQNRQLAESETNHVNTGVCPPPPPRSPPDKGAALRDCLPPPAACIPPPSQFVGTSTGDNETGEAVLYCSLTEGVLDHSCLYHEHGVAACQLGKQQVTRGGGATSIHHLHRYTDTLCVGKYLISRLLYIFQKFNK